MSRVAPNALRVEYIAPDFWQWQCTHCRHSGGVGVGFGDSAAAANDYAIEHAQLRCPTVAKGLNRITRDVLSLGEEVRDFAWVENEYQLDQAETRYQNFMLGEE